MRCKYCGKWSGFFDTEHLDCSQAGKAIASQTTPKNGSRRIENWPLFLFCCAVVAIIPWLPLDEVMKILLMAASLVVYGMVPRMRRPLHCFVLTLALRGKYSWALLLDKIPSRIGGYSKPLGGWIYVEAGRYEEGRLFFQPFAFDDAGQPRLTSHELLFYAMTLSRQEKYVDAQVLLDAAVDAAREVGDAHIALADCLLAQRKDVNRARSLVESVLKDYESVPRGAFSSGRS